MPGIFISYRREDSPGHAGRIFDWLRSRFGSDVVFMDVTAIEAGVDFVDALHKAVGSCDALLAVIGPQWLSATHNGQRRLDDPHDFVRIEIAGALERNVRVLPVLVEGASLPPTSALPDEIGSIVRGQSAVPRPELVGQVGYSENRLAAQAEAIARAASEYLARTGNPRTLQATLRPRIVDRTIIVGLYERAQ